METHKLDASLEPKIDGAVAEWLHALGGRNYPELEKWLISCTDLSKPAPVLYLEGPGRIGKTLLIQSVLQLYAKKDARPLTVGQKIGHFDLGDCLMHCPVILVDVCGSLAIPDLSLLAERTNHTVEQQYKNPEQYQGSVRVAIESNAPGCIRSDWTTIDPRNGLEVTASVGQKWLEEKTIARHVLAI